MNNLKINLIYLVLPLTLMACGGGGGGSTGNSTDPVVETSPDTTSILRGVFIDSPVEGLRYSTETLSGYTDSQGAFNYRLNETVTFSIGNLEFGSAVGAAVITPLTLTGETDLNNISIKAVNIARVLQSLDQEPLNEGKILLPSSLRSLVVSNIDFEDEMGLSEVITAATNLTSISFTLKESYLAEEAMTDYLTLFQRYPKLGAGTHTGTDTTWYLLSMPADGNILIDDSNITTYIYDTDLNPVNLYSGDYNSFDNNTPASLNAGNYLVKVGFNLSTYGGSINVSLAN